MDDNVAEAPVVETPVEEPLSRPRWAALAAVVLSMFLLAAANVIYTGWVDSQRDEAEREADRRWCALLVTLDDAYSSTPPATEIGRRVAAAIHSLRTDLDC